MIELSTKPIATPDGSITWLQTFLQHVRRDDTSSLRLLNLLGHQGFFNVGLLKLPISPCDLTCFRSLQVMITRIDSPSGVAYYRNRGYGAKRASHESGDGFTSREVLRLIASDPFGALAESQARYIPNLEEEHLSETPWYSDLQHRLVVLVANLVTLHTSAESRKELTAEHDLRFIRYSVAQIQRYTRQHIHISHPAEAASILETFLPVFLDDVNVRKHISLD